MSEFRSGFSADQPWPIALSMLGYMVFFGLFSMAIVLTGFRRGERWAWVTMWLFPLFFALHAFVILRAYKHPEVGTPEPLVSGSAVLAITTLTLVLSYRKFFPK